MPRAFTPDDQRLFARLSGDYNPMHMDPTAARRMLFGRPVVHGIHTLLWAIDAWLAGRGGPVRLRTLKAVFRGPVIVGEAVEMATPVVAASGAVRLEVGANGVKLLTATMTIEEDGGGARAMPGGEIEAGVCRARSAAELAGASGSFPLRLEPALATRLFPAAWRWLPGDQFASLLALSRLVGMEAPGLHSVFTGLELAAVEADAGELVLRYQADGYDERFRLLTVRVASPGLEGAVTAALRPEPQAQPTFAEVRAVVRPGEFAGERALIIGGSRGIGEVAVKLLAAGGADVKFTYRSGEVDAERLAAEIAAGGVDVGRFAYDAHADSANLPALRGAGWVPTLMGYFATPFIFSATAGRFSPALFHAFCECYVDDFLAAFHGCGEGTARPRNVLYPSSSALDELPVNMAEYAAAKAAGETLCRSLGKTYRGTRFHCPRLPRLATDQTATLLPVESASPVKTMLGVLRGMGYQPMF